jgi:hypothetical protein
MGLPTLDKTWQYTINQRVAAGSTAARSVLFGIKNAMKAFALNPWTVVGSSNSVAAALDAVDRWAAATNLVYTAAGGTAHSWIVLKQAGVLSNFQICIDLVTAIGASDHGNANFIVSPNAGFTGGSTTNRPTATDEAEFTWTDRWTFMNTTRAYVWHAMQSTDGQCTRIFVMNGGCNVSVMFIDKLKNPRAAITQPFACSVQASADGTTDAATINAFTNFLSLNVRFSTTNGQAALTGEGAFSQVLSNHQRFADDIDGSYWLSPMGVYSYTAGARGHYGTLYDMWWGSPSNLSGDTYDEDENRLVNMAQFIVPSNAAKWIVR